MAEFFSEIFNRLALAGFQNAAETPNVTFRIEFDFGWRGRRAFFEPDGFGQPRRPAVVGKHVNERERNVIEIFGERNGGGARGVFGGSGVSQSALAQSAQSVQPAAAQNFRRVVSVGA